MGQWGPKAKRFFGRVKLRALQTKEAFADVAQEVWGAITEAVVFAVARQLDRGFPVEQPSVVNPPGDEHDEQPFRVFVRLAAEFSALADAPEQQDGVEAQAECPHPSSSVERDDNADEGSMDVDIAQEGVQTPLGGCTSPDPDFEELVETNDPTWNDDEEDDLPTWNDSGGRQQGPRTLVWEDPEGGSRCGPGKGSGRQRSPTRLVFLLGTLQILPRDTCGPALNILTNLMTSSVWCSLLWWTSCSVGSLLFDRLSSWKQ